MPVGSAPSLPQRVDASTTAAASPLAFAWKVPCRVPVEERSKKEDVAVTLRFDLSVAREAGGGFAARYENMEMVEFNGQPMTPALKAQLGPALALTTSLPTMIVSPEGRYVEARGMEQVVDRLLASGLIENDPKVLAMMRSPRVMKLVSNKVGDYWNSWVGMWVGVTLAPREKRDFVGETSLGSATAPERVHLEHLGDAGDHFVRLSCTRTLEAGDALFSALMKEVGMPDLPDAGAARLRAARLRRTLHIEVETDPRDLRPRRMHLENTDVVEVEGDPEPSRKRTETREDRFDWARATGCR
jgi:hypothetical protein